MPNGDWKFYAEKQEAAFDTANAARRDTSHYDEAQKHPVNSVEYHRAMESHFASRAYGCRYGLPTDLPCATRAARERQRHRREIERLTKARAPSRRRR